MNFVGFRESAVFASLLHASLGPIQTNPHWATAYPLPHSCAVSRLTCGVAAPRGMTRQVAWEWVLKSIHKYLAVILWH